MQAHTVLKSVVHKYEDKPVLVLGGRPGDAPLVAAEYVVCSCNVYELNKPITIRYGFRKVYTTLDILAWNRR